MKKILKRIAFCMCITAFTWGMLLISDRKALREELIRLHVVAHSDSAEDQEIKLKVRDAVLQSIGKELAALTDVEAAEAYLSDNLPKIRKIANETLEAAGFDGEAVVSLCKEKFDIREYGTFTLPSGVYESLRIVIGEGAGRNWWCVAFPGLCIPATSNAFADAAVEAGFSQGLTRTLTEEDGYEVRFFLLDVLGRLENYFFME